MRHTVAKKQTMQKYLSVNEVLFYTFSDCFFIKIKSNETVKPHGFHQQGILFTSLRKQDRCGMQADSSFEKN